MTARWKKVEVDLPKLGKLPILHGATKVSGIIGSGVNEFVAWKAKEASWHDHDKTKKLGVFRRNGSIACLSSSA
jgi:hypothetical protein